MSNGDKEKRDPHSEEPEPEKPDPDIQPPTYDIVTEGYKPNEDHGQNLKERGGDEDEGKE
jgi:hypothetical protein